MNIEEAIQKLKFVNRYKTYEDTYSNIELDAIEIVLNELEKKDKVIDLMTEDIAEYEKDIKYYVPEYEEFFKNKEEIKEYYFKEIEKIN